MGSIPKALRGQTAQIKSPIFTVVPPQIALDSSYSRSSIEDVLFLQRKLYMVTHTLNKSHQMRSHNGLTLRTEIPFGESSKSSKNDHIYYYLLLHCEQCRIFLKLEDLYLTFWRLKIEQWEGKSSHLATMNQQEWKGPWNQTLFACQLFHPPHLHTFSTSLSIPKPNPTQHTC